jgi:FKBP-type peptidyl-prolyl cis-trans isomerase FkpA
MGGHLQASAQEVDMAPGSSASGRTKCETRFGGGLALRLAFAIALVAALGASGCASQPKAATPEPAAQSEPAPDPQASETASASVPVEPPAAVAALEIKDTKVGKGAEAKTGDLVTVNYTGYLTDGTKFDSSLNPGRTPFQFTIGNGEVIQGWEQGFAGMKVGGKRKLTIPPELGYGPQGQGPIPPNAVLVFDVELLAVN